MPTWRSGAPAPVHGHGECAVENTDLASIVEGLGLRAERYQFVMLADLHAPLPDVMEGRGLPDGFVLSTWEDLDADEIREAHNRAFADHPASRVGRRDVQWVWDSRALRRGLSLLARDETGAIAAYLESNEYDAVAEATGVREVYVAKVGTSDSHRRRGLASALLRHALERYRGAGFDRAALDVDSENPTGALGSTSGRGSRRTSAGPTTDAHTSRAVSESRRPRGPRVRGCARARTPRLVQGPLLPVRSERDRRRARARGPSAGRRAPRPRPAP